MKVTQLRSRKGTAKTGSQSTVRRYLAEPRRPYYSHLEDLVFEDDFGDPVTFTDYPSIAKDYCHQVISGAQPACKYIIQACKRYLKMLDMAETGNFGFSFSPVHACDFLAFAEELPLVEDNFRGVERIELEPWQIWVGCNLYGFRDRYGFRFIRECYLEVPRKSAKSVFATAIALYDVRNPKAMTPLVLIAASTLDQANRVYTPVRKTIEKDEELREFYKLRSTNLVINCDLNSGTIEKVASIGERQDGWNPTTIILEELHAQNPDVYAVLKSAMGSRGGQLLFQITTAGRHAFGLAWDNRKSAIRILEGIEDNWWLFAAIYTIDKEDMLDDAGKRKVDNLFSDERLWIKACPNLGVSFDMAAFHMLALGARQKPQEREEFFRTRLNIWTNAASRLIDPELWGRGEQEIKPEDYKAFPCFIGVDLSTTNDLSAAVKVFEISDTEIAVFARFYMSGDSPLLTDPDYSATIRDWCDRGYILNTGEGPVDQRIIEADLRKDCGEYNVVVMGFDPAMASQIMKNLEDTRLPVAKYLCKPYTMTAPTDDLIGKAHAQSRSYVLHNGDPVLTWCASNAHGERRTDDTILPKKDSETSLNKIDGFIGAAIANGLRMNPEYASKVKKPSVYEQRGLIGHQSNGST